MHMTSPNKHPITTFYYAQLSWQNTLPQHQPSDVAISADILFYHYGLLGPPPLKENNAHP